MARTDDRTTEVEVELDIFSGRSNPRWTLAADRAQALTALIEQGSAAEWREPPGLGYRGFVLTTEDSRTRLYRGVLAISRGDRTVYRGDAQALEELLLQQAREHGYGEVLDAFGAAPR